jgi:hypothetical protein
MIRGVVDEVRRSRCRSVDRQTSPRAAILSSMIQGNADRSLARPTAVVIGQGEAARLRPGVPRIGRT